MSVKLSPQTDARYVATIVLQQILAEQRTLSECLEPALISLPNARERALAQALCYGVMRWLPRLQAVLSKLMPKPLKTKDFDVYAVLLIGIYQHLYLRTPAHAATAATVNIVKMLDKNWASGLVNAILRNLGRKQAELEAEVDQKESARFAHPAWLLNKLQKDWGKHWQAIAEANNLHPPMNLRVNLRKCSREAYLQLLTEAGLAAQALAFTRAGLQLEQAVDVQRLPHFDEGWVSVQDGAAQLAVELLDVPAGARVLDACAAPGGKTAHLLETYDPAYLLALDNQPDRVNRLRGTLERLQLTAETRCADASQLSHWWWDSKPFDRILLDAPCSASGVIRRHPDIKYVRQPKEVALLVTQQALLLNKLWETLAPAGQLLYVTCSVFAEENHLQIQRFLVQHPEAEVSHTVMPWAHSMPVGWQVLPGEQGFDGFYYALIHKHPPR